MTDQTLKVIYFGNDSASIKMLLEVTDGTCSIVEDNKKFKDKAYLNELSGNHIAIIDGDCVDFNIITDLMSCIRKEIKCVGLVFTSSDITVKNISYLFNELELHWYLPKPWQGQTIAKALSEVESKLLKELRPLPKPLTAVDPLTGLPNYSSFRQELSFEFAKSQKSNIPLSLIRINFDGLSFLNSKLGFQKADQVLREITLSIRKFLPRQYFLARYNGDNLVIIAKALNYQFAERVAEDIRRHVVSLGFALSISLGVGTYPAHSRTLEELLTTTDQALMTAKRRGKNQTVVVTLS